MPTDPNVLLQAAKCFKCIPKGLQNDVLISLIVQWANHQTASIDWKPSTAVANWDDSGGNHNGDLPTFLATADIASVITLTLNGVGITSLTGLQFLPALQTLDCSNNALTSLDCSGMVNLFSVACGNNAITSLNLTGCAGLTILDCDTNPLPGIDAVVAPVAGTILDLNCAACGVNTLNLPALSVLQRLSIQNNPIATMDFSSAGTLTFLDISGTNVALIDAAGVDLSPSSIATLRVLNCNLLTQVTPAGLPLGTIVNANFSGCSNLVLFQCSSSGSLVTLNISNCTAMTGAICTGNGSLLTLTVAGDTSLTTLDSSGNASLTTLTLTGCTALVTLDCSNCNITGTLDVSPAGASLTTLTAFNNPSLTTLTLTACTGLTTLDVTSCDITGPFDVSPCLSLVNLSCPGNANLTGITLTGLAGINFIDCNTCNITGTLNVSPCTSILQFYCFSNASLSGLNLTGLTMLDTVDCNSCGLNQAAVDNVLCTLDANGALNGTLDITSNTAPSAAGLVCSANLDPGKGWTVTHD